MSTWTAQELALVISTSTAAITAIASVLVPAIKVRYERNHQRNSDVQEELKTELKNLFEVAEKRKEYVESMPLNRKLLAEGKNINIPKERYQSQALRFKVISEGHGISSDAICDTLQKTADAYLSAYEAMTEERDFVRELNSAQKIYRENEGQLLDEIRAYWVAVRKKYPV